MYEILENELVESTDAYKNGHIVYLAHPNVWYTAEGKHHAGGQQHLPCLLYQVGLPTAIVDVYKRQV